MKSVYITSDDAVALKRLPKSLIILGGGAIACEFAQFFARFGVKVTLIQRSGHMLKEFDMRTPAIEIEKVFRREGIQIFTGHKTCWMRKRKGKLKTVSFEHKWRKEFRFRRGNFVCAWPRAKHGVAGSGKRRREN